MRGNNTRGLAAGAKGFAIVLLLLCDISCNRRAATVDPDKELSRSLVRRVGPLLTAVERVTRNGDIALRHSAELGAWGPEAIKARDDWLEANDKAIAKAIPNDLGEIIYRVGVYRHHDRDPQQGWHVVGKYETPGRPELAELKFVGEEHTSGQMSSYARAQSADGKEWFRVRIQRDLELDASKVMVMVEIDVQASGASE